MAYRELRLSVITAGGAAAESSIICSEKLQKLRETINAVLFFVLSLFEVHELDAGGQGCSGRARVGERLGGGEPWIVPCVA